jgi:hypothetical protein
MDVMEKMCILNSSGSRYDLVVGAFADRNERLGSIKGGIYLEQQSKCQLFKNDSLSQK